MTSLDPPIKTTGSRCISCERSTKTGQLFSEVTSKHTSGMDSRRLPDRKMRSRPWNVLEWFLPQCKLQGQNSMLRHGGPNIQREGTAPVGRWRRTWNRELTQWQP